MNKESIAIKKQGIAETHNQIKAQIAILDSQAAESAARRELLVTQLNQTKGAYDALSELESELAKEGATKEKE